MLPRAALTGAMSLAMPPRRRTDREITTIRGIFPGIPDSSCRFPALLMGHRGRKRRGLSQVAVPQPRVVAVVWDVVTPAESREDPWRVTVPMSLNGVTHDVLRGRISPAVPLTVGQPVEGPLPRSCLSRVRRRKHRCVGARRRWRNPEPKRRCGPHAVSDGGKRTEESVRACGGALQRSADWRE